MPPALLVVGVMLLEKNAAAVVVVVGKIQVRIVVPSVVAEIEYNRGGCTIIEIVIIIRITIAAAAHDVAVPT